MTSEQGLGVHLGSSEQSSPSLVAYYTIIKLRSIILGLFDSSLQKRETLFC